MGKWQCNSQHAYHPSECGYDETYAKFKPMKGVYPHYQTRETMEDMEILPGIKPGDYLNSAGDSFPFWPCMKNLYLENRFLISQITIDKASINC